MSRNMSVERLAGTAALLAAYLPVAWAGGIAAGPLTTASGPSPFAGCTADAGQSGFSYAGSEVEPWVAVDPADGNNIVGAWQQDRWSNGGSRGLVAGYSGDGGATWQSAVIPGLTKCSGGEYERASDPWVTFAPNGDVYHIAITFNDANNTNAVLVNKSTDGGRTWSPPITLIRDTAPSPFNDKETITADPHDARYVYAIWDRLLVPPAERARGRAPERAVGYRGPTWFSRTTDGGATWEPARAIYDPGTVNQTIGNQIVVLPNGDLVNVFNLIASFKNAHKIRGMNVAVLRSSDRGEHWSGPVLIDKLLSVGVTDPESGEPVRTGDIIPEIAVDPNSGYLYVIWQDARFSGVDQIAFSMSVDGGLNWSPTLRLGNAPVGVQAFTPTARVRADGTVAVGYYDFRNNDDGADLKADYYVTHCHPTTPATCADPAGWSDAIRVTSTSFDMRQAPFALGYFVGDYAGLGTDGTDFLAFFAQPAGGDPASVFFRRLGGVP